MSSSSSESFLNTSSSSSSSSSMEYSSSSSSSYLDYFSEQILPFTWLYNKNKEITTMTIYGGIVFAGTRENGTILQSSNRYTWTSFYKTNDSAVSSLFSDVNYIYCGTSPNGFVYRINMSNMSVATYGPFGGQVIGFAKLNGNIYMATSQPSIIYVYNLKIDKWDIFHQPYSNKINKIKTINSKIHVSMDGESFISYDGEKWEQTINTNNIKRISTNIFSKTSYEVIDLPKSNEDIIDIYPKNRTSGILSFDGDGKTLTMGSSNFGRLYNYNTETNILFDTDAFPVYDILNLDLGKNLASIGNKLYYIYCEPYETTTTIPIPTPETTNPNEGKNIVVLYPNGNEIFESGEEINIQWSSTKGLNEVVKIELYKGSEFISTINGRTSNDGSYIWNIPLSLSQGTDYKVKISWLSAGETKNEDMDESDNGFSIVFEKEEVTTEEISSIDLDGVPNIDKCHGIPILEMDDEHISCMIKDIKEGILLGTSKGRILSCDTAMMNAYLTGNRTVYANVVDGYGHISENAKKSFMYSLYRKIMEIGNDKIIDSWRYEVLPSSIGNDNMKGIFLSSPMKMQDGGKLTEIVWTEEKGDTSNIIVYIRTGETLEELSENKWVYGFSSTDGIDGIKTMTLNNIPFNGLFVQVKIELSTILENPLVSNLILKYSAQNAEYFYTINFSLDYDNQINQGFIVANVSEPKNTKIEFGIAGKNTSDWSEYEIVPLDSLFDISNTNSLKVGIKMTSYSSNIPIVNEFSLMTNGKIKKVLS